jgi:hypothetical protein
MLQDLQNKKVKVYLGVVPGWSDIIKGEVIAINDSWLKIQTKKTIELINQGTIKRVTMLSS